MSNLELNTARIDTLVKAMRKQELSPVELVNWYLDRIEKLNPVLNLLSLSKFGIIVTLI